MQNSIFDIEDLVSNPSARIPVVIVADTSYSMYGAPIKELNDGNALFYDTIKKDNYAYGAAEIATVTFGGKARCLSYFKPVYNQPYPPHFDVDGDTPMGEAVNMALDMLNRRKEEYKRCGVSYYQPWMVLMTDGQPNGSAAELQRAKERVTQLVNDRKLTVIPVGIGPDADMNVLSEFSPRLKPLRLKGLRFKDFFTWFSQSVSSVAQSQPGDMVSLDLDSIKGWAEL